MNTVIMFKVHKKPAKISIKRIKYLKQNNISNIFFFKGELITSIKRWTERGQPYKGMAMGKAPELERTLLKIFFIVFFLLPSGRLSARPSTRSESSSAHSVAAARTNVKQTVVK